LDNGGSSTVGQTEEDSSTIGHTQHLSLPLLGGCFRTVVLLLPQRSSVVGPTQEGNFFSYQKTSSLALFSVNSSRKNDLKSKKIGKKKQLGQKKMNCQRKECGLIKPMYSLPVKAALLDG
jgi:hypothetical protein